MLQKFPMTGSQFKSLLGAMILKFGTGVITCWGNINLYFLSLFHYQGTRITPQTNSLILLVSVPPMLLALLITTKLCEKFGYERIIRICCLVFLLAPLGNLIDFNIYMFCIFGITIPGAMYAMLSIPVLNSIWTQFPDSRNKATAALVFAFGIGSIVWNLLFMHMINPNNEDTTDQHPEDSIHFFSEEVTKRVQKTAMIGYAITGVLSVFGSLLIKRRQQDLFELKQQKQFPNLESQKQARSPSAVQLSNQPSENTMTYRQALRDSRFLIIMIISVLTGLYQIYLMMNYKIIFMPIIGDDHFLSYTSMVCSIVSMGGAFFWGFLGDARGVSWTVLILSILDLGGKIFSDFAIQKWSIFLMVVLIGLISKSMTTLAGPGFVEFFGLKIGTQLLPLKGVALILGYVLVPLFQILTSKFLNPHQYLVCISFLSVITLLCAIKLYLSNKCKKESPKQQSLQNISYPKNKQIQLQLQQQQRKGNKNIETANAQSHQQISDKNNNKNKNADKYAENEYNNGQVKQNSHPFEELNMDRDHDQKTLEGPVAEIE